MYIVSIVRYSGYIAKLMIKNARVAIIDCLRPENFRLSLLLYFTCENESDCLDFTQFGGEVDIN